MKKLLISTTLIATSLLAEVVTILPYGATISYNKEAEKSIKDSSTLYGVHTSVGTLSYLLEFDYAKFQTTYKDPTFEKLNQDDISIAYGKYFTNFMLRAGAHYIKSNDVFLGDGYSIFASLGGYNYFGYNKLEYGLDNYYTTFAKGRDELNTDGIKPINIIQLSPYLSYYKAFNLNWGNTLVLRYNYQIAKDYIQESYGSFELSDTIFYKQSFLTLKGYSGEMRTGVKDSGFTVINTLDLMKSGYGIKLGYTFAYTTTVTLSYDTNTFREVGLTQDGTSEAIVASLNYRF